MASFMQSMQTYIESLFFKTDLYSIKTSFIRAVDAVIAPQSTLSKRPNVLS